tara:strand:- start:107 stop:1639 length:1533 start_codon:yes stop_codon:yes gene_type:complete
MGLKNALTIFENVYDAEKSKIAKLSGGATSNNIFTYTLRTDEVAQQLSTSAIRALTPFRNSISPATYNIITSTEYCKVSAKEVINGMKRAARPANLARQRSFTFGGTNPFAMPLWSSFRGAPGVYRLGKTLGGRGISVRFVSGPGGGNNPKVTGFNLQVRNMLWAHWSGRTGRIYGVTSQTAGQKATAAEMQVAHERDTTIGAMMLKSLRETNPTMTISGVMTVSEIVDQVESNLGIDLERNYEVTKSGFSFKWNIFASMRKNTAGSEDTDVSRIKSSRQFGPGKAEEAIYQLYEKKFGKFWAKLWVLRGSTPPKDQAIGGHAAALIDGILRPLTKAGIPDMRFKVNKTAKNFKGMKDRGVIKKPTNRKPKTTTTIVSQTITGTSIRPQKEKRKATQNISRLQALINKRLPAEVRRNMGRPALENRSGTFSNSAEILKIGRARKGLTADYTYLKTGGGTPPRTNQPGVYQTFENSGRWPSGYNPKDLIKKSIRNLALQYTEEKFIQLRRR